MAKIFFSERETNASIKAQQLFPFLTSQAQMKKHVYYSECADLLNYSDPRPVSNVLYYILYYCIKHNLPPLSYIVVDKKSGLPKIDEITFSYTPSFNYSFNWFDVMIPTSKKLNNAYTEITNKKKNLIENGLDKRNTFIEILKIYDYKFLKNGDFYIMGLNKIRKEWEECLTVILEVIDKRMAIVLLEDKETKTFRLHRYFSTILTGNEFKNPLFTGNEWLVSVDLETTSQEKLFKEASKSLRIKGSY